MTVLVSGGKRARNDDIEESATPSANKAMCAEVCTGTQIKIQTKSAAKCVTDRPLTEHTNHTEDNTVWPILLDHSVDECKIEAKLAVSKSITTHNLLQVVKPRRRTIANKAKGISASVAESLEAYIDSSLLNTSGTTDLDLERVCRFCAPHDKNVIRFSKELEMYAATGALFGFIFEQIRFKAGNVNDLNNIISNFKQNDFTVSDGNTDVRIDKALRIGFDGLGELKDEDAETKGSRADIVETETYMDIFAVIEAKVDNQVNDKDGADSEIVTDNKQRVDATMQLYLCTHTIYLRQHARRFVWGFTVCGSVFQVCLFTHDVIVRSNGIDVATKRGRKYLVELFTNMSFCDKDQLGYDPTIYFNKTSGQWQMYVFENGKVRRCAINNVTFAADSVFGRHTRCFHCKTISESDSGEESKDVLVKDTWADQKRDLNENEDASNEATLLRTISEGFRHVGSLAGKYSDLWAGGIVQITGSDSNVSDDSTDYIFAALDQDVREKIPNRVHKRLAMEPVGEPLRIAKVVDETIIAVADAMEAYMAAWVDHGIMHRDISTSNILIRRDQQTGTFLNGALIDFDCAITINRDEPSTDQRPNMTGTVPFMSINCLAASSNSNIRSSCVPRTILDDWESALYVLCWLGTFGINYHDSAAVKRKVSGTDLEISKWQTDSPGDIASDKMCYLSSRQIFSYNILSCFYEPPQLESSSSEPSRAASVSYKPLKRLVESMRMTLFKNPNLSKLGRGTLLNLVEEDFFDDLSDNSSADIPETCWDAHVDPNDRNPFSRRAQVADKIGNALLDVMVKARSKARDRMQAYSAHCE